MNNKAIKLEYTTQTTHEIYYNDLDTFVQNVLGYKKYEFACVEECGNDSYHEFSPDGEISKYEMESLQKWESGGYAGYSNHAIFNKLVKDGYLPAATYMVHVSW